MKENITLADGGEKFDAYISVPEGDNQFSGLILIEEIWGVDAHIKDVSDRYANEGFIVISPELLGGTGILEKMSPAILEDMKDPAKSHAAQAKMREIMQPMSTKEFSESALRKLQTSFDYLAKHPRCDGRIGVLGFCFGGTYSFHLAINEKNLKACVVFYGQPPQPLNTVSSIPCPVLEFNGEKDERIIATLPALADAMKTYDKDFTSIVYKNTGHAFFNDTRPQAYNKEAADDAWIKSLAFLKKNLSEEAVQEKLQTH